jgi:hypothetical protein
MFISPLVDGHFYLAERSRRGSKEAAPAPLEATPGPIHRAGSGRARRRGGWLPRCVI